MTACWTSVLADVFAATGLALILIPGFIFSFPSVPKEGQFANASVAKRTFFTQMVTWSSVVVHILIFFVLFLLYKILKAMYWENCTLW
jgi:hypothetical protein